MVFFFLTKCARAIPNAYKDALNVLTRYDMTCLVVGIGIFRLKQTSIMERDVHRKTLREVDPRSRASKQASNGLQILYLVSSMIFFTVFGDGRRDSGRSCKHQQQRACSQLRCASATSSQPAAVVGSPSPITPYQPRFPASRVP